ncbi:MAG: CheR family methyltransferase [Spirochaetia bacterium]
MAKSNNLKQGDSPPLIVGIGASAGAVDTLGAFFEDIPENPGVAFVVVIHLSPDHTSTLPDLISRHTSVPAVHAENGQRVEVNRIYVIPPDTELALMNGTLHLMPRKEQRPWLPIDSFFRTLADEAGDHAIGIVLSGTGSDGSLGLQAIKAHLGLTMAQSPESAAFPGMPQAAIDSGAVDHVSNPKGLATELLDYAAHFAKRRENEEDGEEEIEEQMNKIFVILRRQIGHDFSAYKESTVQRRLKRRLDVHKVDALEEYVRYLQNSPREVELLFRDLLIGVTQFFREPEAFEKLKQSVLPELVRDRGEDEPIRVWVPGCSSGEEAYSMAITIREFLDDNGMTTPVNIFATDIDEEAIERARRGVFPIAIQRDVGERRAQRFFAQKGDSYEVAQSVRQMIVFSTQDVIKDAPFTRLDLLSCRNVMIYLKPEVQKRLVPLFHYSLNAGGFLLLGSSETVGNFPDLFSSIPGDARIYRAKSVDAGVYARTGVEFPIGTRGTDDGTRRVRRHASPVQTERVLQRFLLNRHTPPTVFVNRKREVVYIHGRTGRYFELATGMARMDIVEMARGAISLPLSQALRQAFREEQLVERTGIRLEEGGSPTLVHLSVEPVREHENGPDLFAVVLTEEPLAESSEGGERSAGADESGDSATDEQVRHLESELQATRERLQTTVEELETTNEELKSSLEEYQSTNEELQSSNEELESSKEEMQSLNEELSTVNNELQTKNEELARSNAEMKNFLDSLHIPIVFVDNQLRIKRFTHAVTKLISIIDTDVNRHIGQINHNFVHDEFIDDMDEVVRRARQKERLIRTQSGTPYRVHMSPYKNIDNVLEGVLVSFLEVSETDPD